MADACDHDAYAVVFDSCNDAIVADAILPETLEVIALQRFAKRTRIGGGRYPLIKEAQDPSSRLAIETLDIGFGAAIEINPPRHNAS